MPKTMSKPRPAVPATSLMLVTGMARPPGPVSVASAGLNVEKFIARLNVTRMLVIWVELGPLAWPATMTAGVGEGVGVTVGRRYVAVKAVMLTPARSLTLGPT